MVPDVVGDLAAWCLPGGRGGRGRDLVPDVVGDLVAWSPTWWAIWRRDLVGDLVAWSPTWWAIWRRDLVGDLVGVAWWPLGARDRGAIARHIYRRPPPIAKEMGAPIAWGALGRGVVVAGAIWSPTWWAIWWRDLVGVVRRAL